MAERSRASCAAFVAGDAPKRFQLTNGNATGPSVVAERGDSGGGGRSAPAVDHAGTDRDAGGLVDEDEGARGAVLRVRVAQQRHGGAQLDAADLVEAELLGVLVAVQRVDVEPVLDVLDQRPGG